jgi:hypothetical protein
LKFEKMLLLVSVLLDGEQLESCQIVISVDEFAG